MERGNSTIEELYPTYSKKVKSKLIELKQLIRKVASESGNLSIKEELKWGQLSFSTKDGTPIRIDRFSDNQVALLVHCQTTLVEDWRALFGGTLQFSKNRAILLSVEEELPTNQLSMCIEMAFNYHKKNKK